MIRSMTGFGKAEFEINNKRITIEVKSLNSKSTDINTRIPQLFREKEIDIRRMLTDRLVRGKIDCNIFVESLGDASSATINPSVVKSYFSALQQISLDLNLPVEADILQIIMRLPDTVKVQYDQLNEEEWSMLNKHLNLAIDQVDSFRLQEGKALETDLRSSIAAIESLQNEIAPFETQRIENVKIRLTEALAKLQSSANANPDRYEQELIFYLERLDFNEEKVRLTNHLDYFIETVNEHEANGKKLAFITQEIGREINTLGAKANESNIQRLVVQMKDYLERIKEQTLNVL